VFDLQAPADKNVNKHTACCGAIAAR